MKGTIRPATIADLENVGPVAEEFYASSRFLTGFNLQRFAAFWAPMLESGLGSIIVAIDESGRVAGAIGGVIYPEPYTGELVATEFFWFVSATQRGQGMTLYREFEAWARRGGASQIRMVHLLDSMPERLSAVYKRLGFEPAETHYVKELNQ